MCKKLKIFFVTDSLTSGGAERVMSVLANEFLHLGHDISIISKVHKQPFYELDQKVRLLYPKNKINYTNKISTLFSRIKTYRDIYKILKKEKPNLVIPFSTSTNGTVILICKLLRLPVIASEHTNYKVKQKLLTRRIIKRHIYPLASMLTVLTERDKIEYYGKFMKNVVVMPNPLPLIPIKKANIYPREKVILAVGNVSRWKIKGFDNLLKIFSKISINEKDWKLKIAGGGDQIYLLNIIKNLKLENKVILLGEVKDIQSLMQKSSIFVLTSRWEGLPMVLIEAMSQGMACIAFNCFSGPADIITNEVDGILVEDQNINQFVIKLSELMKNKNLQIKLGTNAIDSSKKYLPEKIVEQWEKLFESLNLY